MKSFQLYLGDTDMFKSSSHENDILLPIHFDIDILLNLLKIDILWIYQLINAYFIDMLKNSSPSRSSLDLLSTHRNHGMILQQKQEIFYSANLKDF